MLEEKDWCHLLEQNYPYVGLPVLSMQKLQRLAWLGSRVLNKLDCFFLLEVPVFNDKIIDNIWDNFIWQDVLKNHLTLLQLNCPPLWGVSLCFATGYIMILFCFFGLFFYNFCALIFSRLLWPSLPACFFDLYFWKEKEKIVCIPLSILLKRMSVKSSSKMQEIIILKI